MRKEFVEELIRSCVYMDPIAFMHYVAAMRQRSEQVSTNARLVLGGGVVALGSDESARVLSGAARRQRRTDTPELALSGDGRKRCRSFDLLHSCFDQVDHLIGMGNHRQVVRVHLDE